jgi:hypothetical protein
LSLRQSLQHSRPNMHTGRRLTSSPPFSRADTGGICQSSGTASTSASGLHSTTSHRRVGARARRAVTSLSTKRQGRICSFGLRSRKETLTPILSFCFLAVAQGSQLPSLLCMKMDRAM